MGNPVIHFEVAGADGKALEKFYGELFGWHIEHMEEMQYGMVDTHAGKGINGGIATSEEGPYVTIYMEVPNAQEALDKAIGLGATKMADVMAIPNIVTFAMFADPAGNVVGVVEGDGTGSEGGVSSGSNPAVDWFDILGSDGKALREFYTSMFGWEYELASGMDYGMITPGARGIPGGVGTNPGGGNSVCVYARVEDLEMTLKKAESLGGQITMPPAKVAENTTIAQFTDPDGNTFGVFLSE